MVMSAMPFSRACSTFFMPGWWPTRRMSVLPLTLPVTRPPNDSTIFLATSLPWLSPTPPGSIGKTPVRTTVFSSRQPAAAPGASGRGITNMGFFTTTGPACGTTVPLAPPAPLAAEGGGEAAAGLGSSSLSSLRLTSFAQFERSMTWATKRRRFSPSSSPTPASSTSFMLRSAASNFSGSSMSVSPNHTLLGTRQQARCDHMPYAPDCLLSQPIRTSPSPIRLRSGPFFFLSSASSSSTASSSATSPASSCSTSGHFFALPLARQADRLDLAISTLYVGMDSSAASA
mmetsp:Transcript_26090/g.83259  ORF Transcript_26090/g.83259 Transcript_26090/m.83259 type:complete len:287 (+) Transcript_26090:757-1617(+)